MSMGLTEDQHGRVTGEKRSDLAGRGMGRPGGKRGQGQLGGKTGERATRGLSFFGA